MFLYDAFPGADPGDGGGCGGYIHPPLYRLLLENVYHRLPATSHDSVWLSTGIATNSATPTGSVCMHVFL